MAKTIVFRHRTGTGQHDFVTEEVEFDDNATEEEIREEFSQWAWEQVMDNFTWYHKEER